LETQGSIVAQHQFGKLTDWFVIIVWRMI
jgi:hypothetical protein